MWGEVRATAGEAAEGSSCRFTTPVLLYWYRQVAGGNDGWGSARALSGIFRFLRHPRPPGHVLMNLLRVNESVGRKGREHAPSYICDFSRNTLQYHDSRQE